MTISTPDRATTTTPAPGALWYTRCPVPTVSGVAQHFRWLHHSFDEIGVRLDSVRAAADRSVRESHFTHDLAGSFREGGNVPPIWTRSQGQDTAVVAITWVDEAQLVLVRPDSDIRTVDDLRGRRLGLGLKPAGDLVDVLRAESLRGLLTALRLHEVGRDEVEWVDLPAVGWELRETSSGSSTRNLLTSALLEDRVDAVFVKGAGTAAALDLGLRPVFDLNTREDPLERVSAGSPRPVTVDAQTVQRHPELVDRYLAVLLLTAAWAADHPDEVVDAVAAETGTGADAVRQAFGSRLHRSLSPTLDATSATALTAQKDFLLAEGFIGADVDVDAWIDPGPLARAQDLAATLTLR